MRTFLKDKGVVVLGLILAFSFFVRIWGINRVPPSLFGDEIDVGYQAYSILKTGKDYMGNFMPLHFRSIAEYRTPLFLYTDVLTVSIFGISPLGIRLPSVIFGVLSVLVIYLLVARIFVNKKIGLVCAGILAITPWHIHYSRAGFEVSELIFFLLVGIYFFFRGLKDNKYLPLSAVFLAFTPWIYSTAKFYLPIMLIILCAVWFREIRKVGKKHLVSTLVVFAIILIPFIYSTVFGGGAQRFGMISIFNDPEMTGNLGALRLEDVRAQSFLGSPSLGSSVITRVFHNRFIYYSDVFIKNYTKAFSSEFLFLRGDTIPRHNVTTYGETFLLFAPFIILGLVVIFRKGFDKKTGIFLLLWLVTAPIPSALTQDGGTHATRLILMLPPLTILASLGVYWFFTSISNKIKTISIILFSILVAITFIRYEHDYFYHYPLETEKLWHFGYEQVVDKAASLEKNYQKVIISSYDEPSLLFFLGWSMFPPSEFQRVVYENKPTLGSFGEITALGKYYFPDIGKGYSLYDLGKVLPEGVLYVAPFKEIGLDLILEPSRIPGDLRLVDSVTYPSGQPAFYFLEKNN